MSKLKASGLTKAFGELRVFNEIEFEFEAGKVHFLTGANGIGKSVLARCIAGLEKLDRGLIEIDGESYTELNWTRQKAIQFGVDYLPQDLPNPKDLDVHEFVSLCTDSLLFRKSTSIDLLEQVEDRLAVNLTSIAGEKLSSLPISTLQLVYIARALLRQSNTIILDEPTANLTTEHSKKLEEVLTKLAGDGKRIVVIAHPQQYSFDTQGNTWTLHRHGIVENTSQEETPNLYQPRKHTEKNIGVSVKLQHRQTHQVKQGEIVAIQGQPSGAFRELLVSISNAESKFASWENGSAGVRVVPFDGPKSILSDDMSLFANAVCYLGLRNTAFFNKLGRVDRELVVNNVIEPISKSMNLGQVNASTMLGSLSGGNRQRFAIGLSSFGPVRCIVGGDVFRGLDQPGVTLVTKLILRKAAEGSAFLLLAKTGSELEANIAHTLMSFNDDGLGYA